MPSLIIEVPDNGGLDNGGSTVYITYCIVGLYRLFGSECLLLIHSEVFTKSTHPSTECVYWLTDAYHLQTLRTVYCLIFTALDMIERFSFCSEDIGNFRDRSTVLIITVSLFSEGSLFIVPLYFTISPSPSGTMWLIRV